MRTEKGRWIHLAAACLLGAAGAACHRTPAGVDLMKTDGVLVRATAAGRDLAWVKGQTGKPIRLHDVVRRTLPASPPSRLEYELEVPEGAHLSLACGIPEDRHDLPGVEFSVKLKQGDRETVLATELLDPVNRPKQRRWVPLDLDLKDHAGRATLVLETRGFDAPAPSKEIDPKRAFWGAPTITSPKNKAPLVVLYLVDTLRADHTTPYGYARDTTPELKKFAQDAVVFETAISAASWTKPSVASIFTSQLPGRHRAVQLRDKLDDRLLTIAEMMKAQGFFTGAAISNSVIYAAGTNFEQGFDVYSGLHGGGDKVTKIVEAGPVVDTALQWLNGDAGLPGFLYVHTMDPHVPYTPPAPFDMKFEPHPAAYGAEDPREDYQEPADRERMIAQYDGEVAYGDQEFGRLMRELKARGRYDDALIVFVADHGEEFLDHGQWTHGKSVHDELVHVPLIVKFPGRRDAGKRVARQVQTLDIVPTILEALGLPEMPRELIGGRSLQPAVRGEAPERAAISEISHRGFVAFGMRTEKDKYVRRFSPNEDEQYFDLLADPKEMANRVTEAVDRSRKLKSDLEVAMVESLYRHNLKFVGGGTYSLTLKCSGWIDGLETVAFGTSERATVDKATQTVTLEVKPKPGQPREVMFSVRPMGAPVWVAGTRDGRPLSVKDVLMAEEGIPPQAVPFKLPEVESESERTDNMLAAPKGDTAGLHIWLTLRSGHTITDLDQAARERLKALGYLGN
jgi:arylsulfatase A-like enzyme